MEGSSTLKNQLQPWRVRIFMLMIGVIFAVYIGRLFTLQVLEHETYLAQAVDNSTTEQNLASPRGVIYDRNGSVLARNVASYNVVVIAAELPGDTITSRDPATGDAYEVFNGATQEIFRELSEMIDVPVNRDSLVLNPYVPCTSAHGIAQIAEYATNSRPYDAVRIKCDISRDLAMTVMEKSLDWPGISVEIEPIREYPTNAITAALVGFLGPIPESESDAYEAQGLIPNRDKVGYAGLEYQYQDLLAGKNGLRVAEIDVGGAVTRPDIQPPQATVPGLNLRLTIDTRLQQAVDTILKDEIESWNRVVTDTKKMNVGVVIAMNPQTGEILAMVTTPSYENARMSRIIPGYYYDQLANDPTNPLLNHAVGDVLPAGSVFKLVTAVGGLNEGVMDVDQIVETPGKLDVTERFYANDPGTNRELVDWIYKSNPNGFGKLDFVHALANSSNVYFYKIGGGYKDEIPEGLGICRLGAYARALGYGPASGVGLPDEQAGLVPDPTWKRINQAESWSSGDTYIASVGQGYVLATPLQVLLSAATIANNGKLMQPTLIREVLDGDGNVVTKWVTAEGTFSDGPVEGGRQISPFAPVAKWDLTTDAVVQVYNETTIRGCEPVPGEFKTVEPWVFEKVKEGMRLAVTEGTLKAQFAGSTIAAAGKTGTAEYCDKYVALKNLCIPGSWPSHAWTVGFAPYEQPEIAVVAFIYNGNEGSTVAGPIVRRVLEFYDSLKKADQASEGE